MQADALNQLQEDVRKVLSKQPAIIPPEQMRSDEALSFPQMERSIEKLVTDSKVVEDIRKDWQEVQKIFQGDPALENFRMKYETIFNALEESYTNEMKQVKKCKEYAAELVTVVSTTQANQKFTNDYAETIGILKTEIRNNAAQVTKLKAKEEEFKNKIANTKVEISEVNKELEKRIEKIQLDSQQRIQDLSGERDEALVERDKILSRLAEVRNKYEYAMKEFKTQEEEEGKNKTEINNLNEQIQHIKLNIAKEESRKKNMEGEMEITKKKIDETVEERDKKTGQTKENVKKIEEMKDAVLAKAKEKEKLHENLHTKISQKNALEKEKEKQTAYLNIITRTITEQREEYEKRTKEILDLEKQLAKAIKEHEIYTSKKLHIIRDRKEIEQNKGWLEQQTEEEQRALEERKKALNVVEDEIDVVFRNKEEINRDIRKGEDEEYEVDGELAELHNNLKKLENHVRGYQIEAQKLNRIINLLEKEQEKYGIDASQAHAKYYQTLEELKIKNNLINELQKKNGELDAKLKHQQNLYEAVRSDRNLYSKNLLQAHAEIGELTKKYTRMSHQVDQLKDELKVKDADLVKQDRAVQKIVRENEKNKVEKGRIEKNISNTETVVKDQEQQIARLKFIISEAQTEKARQNKDYEMVVNERDILGSQLIKRNQELSVLYEKIKISQSNLAKGESFYRERQKEFNAAQEGLIQLRKELESTKQQTECVEDLKQEVSSLEKDLLNQKANVKALQDELSVPMNVHRWRKIEAVDQENYERILKIQALQRRLIAKTEEANGKDSLIKEKEKLYMELKNILARQPGPEIQQELTTYKENLKEKSGQMKKMLGELKEAQNQVNVHKFEIDRVKNELARLKKEYFARRASDDKARASEKQSVLNIGQNMSIPMAYRVNLGMGQELQVGGNPQGI